MELAVTIRNYITVFVLEHVCPSFTKFPNLVNLEFPWLFPPIFIESLKKKKKEKKKRKKKKKRKEWQRFSKLK